MFYQLKIILRNLRRGGIYSAINIGGLAIGMAAAVLILAWIYHEWSYDRFHAKEKQLHVVYHRATYDGAVQCGDWTPMVLGVALKNDYPEIAGMARMSEKTFLYGNDKEVFKISTGCTDPDFLTMFDFPLLRGDRQTALNDPYSVVLTEKAAIRLFGSEEPMGKTLLVDNRHSMTVTGVMKDLPGNTMFQFEALMPMDALKALGEYDERWGNNVTQTFVELQPQVRLNTVNESIRGIYNMYTKNTSKTEVFLYPFSRQHLYSTFENGVPVGGLIDTLRLFGVIAGLILLIACINFMNLSTARSRKRAKEVGVRKVLGSRRSSLINLFLGESIIVAFISAFIALILALSVLPVFRTLMGMHILLDLTNGWFWAAGLGFVILIGLLAGIYPAFYLSSFIPVKMLKGIFREKKGSVSSRKMLVVIQFAIACVLILCTMVIHRQVRYAQDRESGYNRDQLIYTRIEGDIAKNFEVIRNGLLADGVAVSVTRTSAPMTARWANTWGVNWRGKDPESKVSFDIFFADADWTKTAGISITEGRDIDIYTYPTDSTAMLINESAVKAMNFDNPIGEIINTQGQDWHVVGVIKDFILISPYEPVVPMVVGGPAGWFTMINIKLNGANRMEDNLQRTEQLFRQFNPAYPFEYQFLDEEYARKFQNEQKMASLISWFAGLTILISCLGLFALVAYMAETRR
ncbi:MAG: ABC transporter permease, partial [Tannerella sp.]|nr:ABC transporter permease [Tannerella sp.]